MAADDDTLLYLSRGAVEAAMPPPGDLIAAVERAFAAQAAGTVTVGAKARVPVATGHFFQAMPGTLAEPPLAGMKWFGVVPDNPARGLPNVRGLIVLSDIATAQPVAVLDGDVITAARTAAMSAVAAKRLAPRDATRAAFIGCGAQARSHAIFLREVLPELREAVVLGRGAASRDGFAAELLAAGWQARPSADAAATISRADVIVSTVPEYAGFTPFLDARLLKPGAFAVGVDLGRSWIADGLFAFEFVATDDAEQSQHLVAEGRLNAPDPFDADLASLVAGANAHLPSADARVFFVFAGHVLGDLAVAAAVYHRAIEQGLGTRLPL